MMDAQPLALRFKGGRDYLHGTDIYDAVTNALLQRGGEADEIVGAALYFASAASSFTTGALLTVSGGSAR